MGLQLTIKEAGSILRKEELHHLDLANIIATLYNHQENIKASRTLSIAEAQNIVEEKAGQNQFFLSRVSNDQGHKRQLGLTILGTWDKNDFTPQEVIIEKNDFKKGGLRTRHRVRSKSRNDSADFDELIQNLLAQDQALQALEEKSHVSEQASDEQQGSPVIQVSSMEEDSSSSVHEEKKRASTPTSPYDADDFVYESPEPQRRSATKAVKKEVKWEPATIGWQQSDRVERAEEDVLRFAGGSQEDDYLALLDEVEGEDSPILTTRKRPDSPRPFLKEKEEEYPRMAAVSGSSEPSLKDKASSKNDSTKGIGTSPVVPTKTSLKEKATGILGFLKWPTISAALTYGLVRALHAARVITATAIGTMSAIWAGVVFAGVAIAQAMRESVKKNSFKDLAGEDPGTRAAVLNTRLPQLKDDEWSAFKDGFEAQKSIVNQFKACTRPNDYKNSKLYYSGYRLSELDSNYDLDAIEAKRPKHIQ